nr:unnamed protein product [Digitaria exilis]
MAEEKSALQSAREWVVDHKLRAVGTLWLSGIVGSIAYNWSRPGMKTSVKIIHARSLPFTTYTASFIRAAILFFFTLSAEYALSISGHEAEGCCLRSSSQTKIHSVDVQFNID